LLCFAPALQSAVAAHTFL
jgi:hypothetical protein